MDYLFVLINNGWCLKIKSIEQLKDYYGKSASKYGKAFQSLINSKEFCDGSDHADDLAYAIGFYGLNQKQGPIKTTLNFQERIYKSQLDAILKYDEIYINEKGRYFFKMDDVHYDKWIRRKELIFPNFKTEDIVIKKFPGGSHFYAYIGNVEVRNGNIIKWNAY